jgi:hypothetical protein
MFVIDAGSFCRKGLYLAGPFCRKGLCLVGPFCRKGLRNLLRPATNRGGSRGNVAPLSERSLLGLPYGESPARQAGPALNQFPFKDLEKI